MAVQREFYLPSSDGVSRLHCMEWRPDGEIRATLQISHGMIEHIGRYAEFASFMAGNGIAVFGHDHLGHGKTAEKSENLGHFGEGQGSVCVIKDIRRLSVYGAKRYPGVMHFLLGHSMGSYFARRYLTAYQDGTDGAVLIGTGSQPEAAVYLGYLLADMTCKRYGTRFRSGILHVMSVGGYNRCFRPAKSDHDWLSRDMEAVRTYENDELCSFLFTSGAYRDLFKIILSLRRFERDGNLNQRLPVLFLSGDQDPVGGFEKGVRKVYRRYRAAGIEDLTLGFYRGARHEILNETNRAEVYQDILDWIEKRFIF